MAKLNLSIAVRDYEFIAGLDFGKCNSSGLHIGALSFGRHWLAAPQQRVSAESDNDPHS